MPTSHWLSDYFAESADDGHQGYSLIGEESRNCQLVSLGCVANVQKLYVVNGASAVRMLNDAEVCQGCAEG